MDLLLLLEYNFIGYVTEIENLSKNDWYKMFCDISTYLFTGSLVPKKNKNYHKVKDWN